MMMTFERLVANAEKMTCLEKIEACPKATKIRLEKIKNETDVNQEKRKAGREVMNTYLEKMEVSHEKLRG
jgi:hypothetical protein